MVFAKTGLAAKALHTYKKWEAETIKEIRKADEVLKWADWFNKFLEKGFYSQHAGQTLTYAWRVNSAGVPVLRGVGYTTISLNLTTYLWTSQDSLSEKSTITVAECDIVPL